MKKGIEAIIFDADGVIFDSEKLWDVGDAEFMAKRGVPGLSSEVKAKLAGTSLLDGTALLLDSYQIKEDVHTAAKERIGIMEKKYANELEFMEGFKEFLDFAQGRLQTAVATSMSKHLFPLLDKNIGFLKMFGGHVYSVNEVPHAKPAPDIYLYAAKQIDVAPEKCVVIEDAPNGILAAKSAGMYCIGFASTFPPDLLNKADIVFQTFDEISGFIENKLNAL